ncbi:hypothetical protein ETR37_14340, partial [Geobacillus sp. PK12]
PDATPSQGRRTKSARTSGELQAPTSSVSEVGVVDANRTWREKDLFSFQDVYNWNEKADAVMFKSPVIRISIRP